MKRKSALVCAGIMLLVGLAAADTPQAEARLAIRRVLDRQVEAWNRHDLEGFMQGYWHSPELTFFSGASVHRGWDAALARYRQTYQSGGREMGKLDFTDLRIELLGPDAAFVRGGYRLKMPDGSQPHGVFTLVLRRLPEGWRIVHDHTCSADRRQ